MSSKVDKLSDVYASLTQLVGLRQQARGFTLLPRQPAHSVLTGKHGSRLRGRGLSFEEIRAYLPGDDIRTMDWRVTARLRAPHVRVYNEERDRPGLLVVDQRNSMFFGSKKEMKSVTAAKAAALGAWRLLEQGDRVGAVVFGDAEIRDVRPRRSRRCVMHILRDVVALNHNLPVDRSAAPVGLNAALERACRLAKHDCFVAVISDFVDADAETRRLMTRLAAHNDVVVVHVYDDVERELPTAGPLILSGHEGHLEIDSDDPGVRTRFARDYRERVERARAFLVHREVPVLSVHTGGDVASQLRALLGRSVSRQGRKK